MFRLNAYLPIPFGGDGDMEVDLLCPSLRLAIELDGAHHFSDLSAYRRDRRKDMLLQENGYRVLRFLAEDVCERLGDVLDGHPAVYGASEKMNFGVWRCSLPNLRHGRMAVLLRLVIRNRNLLVIIILIWATHAQLHGQHE